MGIPPAAVALALAATLEVSPADHLPEALARAKPGDVVRLGAGEHRGALGRLADGVAVVGAGAGETLVVVPEGEDGAVIAGEGTLRALAVRAGPGRCALKVLGGAARLDDVALSGGSCGAFLDGGSLEGRQVELRGEYGLLQRAGRAVLDGGSARATATGVGLLDGEVRLRRFGITGPAEEGGLAVSRGKAFLEAVTIRAPGPSGIAVSAGGRVEGVAVTVAGASEQQGFLGACVQVIRGAVRLEGSLLLGCAGAALEASGGEVTLAGTDATGGTAGCIVLVNGATARLEGNLCGGRGPGLVAASGAKATAIANRWWTDPVLWVECGSGARVRLGRGETVAEPCAAPR